MSSKLGCLMRRSQKVCAVACMTLAGVSPALSFTYIPDGENQTAISEYWPTGSSASPYYNLGGNSGHLLTCSSANGLNTRWLPGTDGALQKQTDSIEAYYVFRINNLNTNGGYYQYDHNNDIYGTAPYGWKESGAAITAETIGTCYGLDSAKITNFTSTGGPSTFIGDVSFFGITFDYEGYRYSMGVNATSAVNTRIALNEPPTLAGAPSSLSVVEDLASNLSLDKLVFGDADGNTLTVTLTVSAGTFAAPSSGGGVTASLLSNTTIRLVGTASALNTWLDANEVKYLTAKDAVGTGVATLTISASDGTVGLASNPVVNITALNTPDVVNVTADPDEGHYKAGEKVTIKVVFDEAVTATGPSLTLDIGGGRVVLLSSGSGTDELIFEYTVQTGDTSDDLDYLTSSSLTGEITSSGVGGYAADLTLAAPGEAGSLSANADIVIDTTAPTISDANITLSGATGTNGIFKVGDTITVSWVATGSDDDPNLDDSLGSVTVDFTEFGGDDAVPASFDPATKTWTSTYLVGANESTTGSSLNVSVTATDEAGNSTTVTDTSNAEVDATPPVIAAGNISVTGASGSGGIFKIGDTVTARWYSTSAGDGNSDIGGVIFDFSEFGGGSSVVGVNNSGIWEATYTIEEGDIDTSGLNVSVTATDLAGNTATEGGENDAVVDNLAPTLVDGDIAVSGGTGPEGGFKIGDTVMVTWTANNSDTIDRVFVDFSGFGGLVETQATEASAGVWVATYTLVPGALKTTTIVVSVTAFDDAENELSRSKATVYAANTLVPTVSITGPTGVVTEQFAVDIEFNEEVSADLEAAEIRVEHGKVLSVVRAVGSETRFLAEIDPVLGNTVIVQVLADAVVNSGGNGNAESNEYSVLAGSPATAFDEYREQILRVILDEAERSLRSTLGANQRMVRAARDRFMADRRENQECGAEVDALENEECDPDLLGSASVPFDVSRSFIMNGASLSTSGTFFGQTSSLDRSYRRLVFGDFDIQHDGETGSSTATLTGRIAWERLVTERTMLGYFIGGEVSQSNIAGAFEGDNRRIGLTLGGYAVHEVRENLFADGFLTFGAGRNNLTMANDVLDLESDYRSRTLTFGASLSGVIDRGRYQVLPELAFSYGQTWIGDVGFTGRAYGLVDDTLSLDAGSVSLADITFRPEFRISLDGLPVKDSLSVFSFAPRFVCQELRTDTVTRGCGGGAEIGVSGQSADGQTTYDARIIADRVGSRTGTSFRLGVEHRF